MSGISAHTCSTLGISLPGITSHQCFLVLRRVHAIHLFCRQTDAIRTRYGMRTARSRGNNTCAHTGRFNLHKQNNDPKRAFWDLLPCPNFGIVQGYLVKYIPLYSGLTERACQTTLRNGDRGRETMSPSTVKLLGVWHLGAIPTHIRHPAPRFSLTRTTSDTTSRKENDRLHRTPPCADL